MSFIKAVWEHIYETLSSLSYYTRQFIYESYLGAGSRKVTQVDKNMVYFIISQYLLGTYL